MNVDDYGEVVNGPQTFQLLADTLRDHPVVVGWTDEHMTHFDLVLVLRPQQFGSLQRGLRGATDLFVAIIGWGAHAFDASSSDTHPNYVGEKFGLGWNVTAEKLTELINGIRAELEFG